MTKRSPDPISVVRTQRALAAALGRSSTTLKGWIAEGLPRREDGSFFLPDVIAWIVEREAARRVRQAGSSGELDAARIRKTLAEAELRERELEIHKGDWIHISVVEEGFVARARLVVDWCDYHEHKHPECQGEIWEFRDAMSRGDHTEQVKEWQRLRRKGGTLARGRGRPSTSDAR
jgi:hypothetical protein